MAIVDVSEFKYMRQIISFLLFIAILMQITVPVYGEPATTDSVKTFQYKDALQASQDAIGNILGDFSFTNEKSQSVRMQDFQGKPLIISMVYTSCYKICPMTVRHLSTVVEKARNTLGEDSFSVAVIGFDSQYDNPLAMKHFAGKQDIEDKDWAILSADSKTIKNLSEQLGFRFYSSPNGFDHVVQATIVDRNGKIYRQVYGEVFDTQLLMEPLLELILDKPKPGQGLVDSIVDKVRFFCTTYDPYTDSYHFDYSLFIGMLIGGVIIGYVITFIVREYRLGKQPPAV